MVRAFRLIFFSLPIAIVPALSQGTTASIAGTVLSPLAVPYSGAEVQAKSLATGTIYHAISGAKGDYSLTGVPAGSYDFTIVVHGAPLYTQKAVVVEAGKTLRIDARLKDTNLGSLGDDVLAAAALERRPVPTGPAPRTPDGKVDLTGVWAPSKNVDPGNPEMLPWAAAIFKQRQENNGKDIPTSRCLPWGPTFDVPAPFKFIQTPSLMVVLVEDVFSYRQIFLDGRGHPKDADPTWMGHSIGHWEGDTLVVDTTGFNDKSWTPANRPHTDKLHLIERIRRPDAGHIEIETMVDDPGTYKKAWTFKRASNLLPGEEIGEYVCAENNQDVEHLVGK